MLDPNIRAVDSGAIAPVTRRLPWLLSEQLAPLLRPYVRYLPVVIFLGLISTLLESVGIGALIPFIAIMFARTVPDGLPLPVAEIWHVVGDLDPQHRIYALITTVLLLIGSKSLVQLVNNSLLARVHASMSRDIMDALGRQTLRLDYATVMAGAGARAFSLMARSSWLVFEAVRAALLIVQAGASVLVFGIILIWLDWRLSLVAAGGASLIAIFLSAIARIQRKVSAQATAQDKAMLLSAREITNGARIVRLFGQEDREERRFVAASRNAFVEYRALSQIVGFVTPIFDFMIAVIFTGLLLVAYVLHMPAEQVIAFLLLILRAQPHVGQISHARAALATHAGSISELDWLMSAPCGQYEKNDGLPVPAMDQAIVFDRVTYTYPDGTQALAGVSFMIEPGTVTALVGKSGAGKSTIVNLLTALVAPASGEVRLGHVSLDRLSAREWRERVAVAGQDVDLFDGSIAYNIAYGCAGASMEDIAAAARAAGAEGFVLELADGYQSRVDEGGSNLSGGQRQRIGLARALLRRPDLLILDEATSAVDTMTESEILELLHAREYFGTALVISHRASTLAACDRAIVVNAGRVVEDGPIHDTDYFADMGRAGS